MAPRTVKSIHMLVFVAILGAVAASLFGGEFVVVPFLLPAMMLYLFIARKRPSRPTPRPRRLSRLRRRAHGDGRSHEVPAAQGRQEAPLRPGPR